ncbi:AlpA family phage regulatory protein [Acidovorax sp.]|uniref:helix-turn-helix transcriptional regulator n=1 Tax=Acidovorax sp. TaxID=1872122 RepID=UPI0034298950
MEPKNRIIRQNLTPAFLGISKSAAFELQNPRSPRYDPQFPKKIALSIRARGFFEHELLAWLDSRRVNAQPIGRAAQ